MEGGGGGGGIGHVSVLISLLSKSLFSLYFQFKFKLFVMTKAVSNRDIWFIKVVLFLCEHIFTKFYILSTLPILLGLSRGITYMIPLLNRFVNIVCPRSNDPFYKVRYYIKWDTTSWTHSILVFFVGFLLYYFPWVIFFISFWSAIFRVFGSHFHYFPSHMVLVCRVSWVLWLVNGLKWAILSSASIPQSPQTPRKLSG